VTVSHWAQPLAGFRFSVFSFRTLVSDDFLKSGAHILRDVHFSFICLDGLGYLACYHSELILKLWTLRTVGRTDKRSARRKAATCTGQHKHRINADIYASSWNQIYHPDVWSSEDISCLRQRGHCDRLAYISLAYNSWISLMTKIVSDLFCYAGIIAHFLILISPYSSVEIMGHQYQTCLQNCRLNPQHTFESVCDLQALQFYFQEWELVCYLSVYALFEVFASSLVYTKGVAKRTEHRTRMWSSS
jgi:hypothetical protein